MRLQLAEVIIHYGPPLIPAADDPDPACGLSEGPVLEELGGIR
jgi:hypothetical protein